MKRIQFSLNGNRWIFFEEPVAPAEVHPVGDVALPGDVRSVEDVHPTEDVRPVEDVDTAASVDTTADVDRAINAQSGILYKDGHIFITDKGEVVRELNAPHRKSVALEFHAEAPLVPPPSIQFKMPPGPIGFNPPVGIAPLMGFQPPISSVFTPWQPPV